MFQLALHCVHRLTRLTAGFKIIQKPIQKRTDGDDELTESFASNVSEMYVNCKKQRLKLSYA